MSFSGLPQVVMLAIVEIGIGLCFFLFTWWLLGRVLPFSLGKALRERRNPAVAVILFSILLGLGIILSSTARRGEAGERAPDGSGRAGSAPSAQ